MAFVPTMGALHEGHLSLVRCAAERADEVWASIFVNPAQFGPGEDLDRYPRQFESDRALLEREGVALLFAPSTREMYPRAPATAIDIPDLTGALCGAHRPGHFQGVALVVAKLFNIVRPDVAIFGAKDFQQAAVIRRLVTDLDFPVEIVTAPTVREEDGLAMSSRNAYLSAEQRQAATVLHAALEVGAAAVRGGENRSAAVEALMAARVAAEPDASLQYAAAVDPETLQPSQAIRGAVLLALAASVGSVRLIDNALVEVEE